MLHCFLDSSFLYYYQEVGIMKEINLGRILVENRHKRGITQDELSAYL